MNIKQQSSYVYISLVQYEGIYISNVDNLHAQLSVYSRVEIEVPLNYKLTCQHYFIWVAT